MTTPDLACILPVSRNHAGFSSTLESALTLDGCETEVFVVTDSFAAIQDELGSHLEDPRVTVLEQGVDSTALSARVAGLERSHAPILVFLDEGCTLTSDAYLLAKPAFQNADMVASSATRSREIIEVDNPDIGDAIFNKGLVAQTLSGAFVTRKLAEDTFSQLPDTEVRRDSELLILFSFCLKAERLAILPQLLAVVPEASIPDHMETESFEQGCESAQATLAAARILSQNDGWSQSVVAYEGMVQTVLGKLLSVFPYAISKSDRPRAFDALAAAWPAPELVSGIMHWRKETLLPFLESIQGARSLTPKRNHTIKRVAILVPQKSVCDTDTLSGIEMSFRELGIIPKLLGDECSSYQGIFNTCIEISRYDETMGYLARGRELSSALLEQDIDAVIAPISADPAQAPDFLLARLSGIPVAVFCPEHPMIQIPGATMPLLMRQVQMANVLTVPVRKNATFWSMASHARIVVEEESPIADEFVSRVLDALELPDDAPKRVWRPDVSFGPLGMLPKKAKKPELSDAEKQIEEMKRQMELLQARLAGAESEAESLRRQLAESARLDNQSDA